FLHPEIAAATSNRIELASAVRPNRIRNAVQGNEPFVVAVLIAIVDSGTWKNAAAIVLVRAHGRNARIRRRPRSSAVGRSREINIGHVTRTGRIVARVVK